jgi:hypothetical protein
MTLADLRKVTVKKNLRIRFALSNGMECVLNEQGVARVPALNGVPSFNLEDELANAREFSVEPADDAEKGKNKAKPRSYTREEIAVLATAAPGGDAGREEHEE